MADKEDGWVARAKAQLRRDEMTDDSRTDNVSVTWGDSAQQATARLTAALVGTQLGGDIRVAEVTTIIKNQGRVIHAPVKGNQHHCLLFGLPEKTFNNLFS